MIFVRPQHEVEERTNIMRLDFAKRYDTDALREQLYLEQEGICAICRKLMQDSNSVVCAIDHATPVNTIANWDWDTEKACEVANARCNLLLVHAPCNSAKGETDYEEFCAAVKRGDIVLGEIPELKVERIAALKTAQSERARKAGLIGGPIGGRRRIELHGNPATSEGCRKGGRSANAKLTPEQKKERGSKGGRISGRQSVESGHLVRIASLGGRIQGRKNVESGHLARIASKGGRIGGRISGRKNVESGHLTRIRELPQTKEAWCRNGRKLGRTQGRKNVESGHLASICSLGGRVSNHIRYHVRRNIVNPACTLCQPIAA
jgi:hypothetical protein